MNKDIYKEEYSIKKILSEAWIGYKENFNLILLIILVVYIPVNIILYFVPVDPLIEQEGALEAFRIYIKAIQILESLIGIIATMAIAYLIKSKIDGKTVSLSQALKKSISRWLAAIGTNILMNIFLLGLTLLLIIPGIIYYVYWMFVDYVVVLDKKSGKKALDHSKSIVKNRWWKVAGYSLLILILSLIVGITLGIPYWFLPESFLISVVLDTFFDITHSFFTVVSVIWFINLDSTKKESIEK